MNGKMSKFHNRRRLLEDQDSFRKTGVPCGNPQRYGSQEVVRMDPVTCLGKHKLIGGDLETEGEKQLQAMAKKQLNTNVSLRQQYAQHRSFATSGEYNPTAKTLCGVSHLKEYKEVVKQDGAVEELKKCGLTAEEVELKLGQRKCRFHTMKSPPQSELIGCPYGERSSYGLDPEVYRGRLDEIDRRISDKSRAVDNTSRANTGVKEMGRHELEIEHKLTGENSQARSLSDYLTKQKVIKGDPNDPINQLPDLLSDIERREHGKKEGRGERHRLVYSVRDDTEAGEDLGTERERFIGPQMRPEALSDDQGPALDGAASPQPATVDAEGRRMIVDTVEDVPEEIVKKYRLDLEEIRALPRFENYFQGEPSNVLYLKNLSSLVSERDLVSLFGRFEDDKVKVVYRLMSGRMRGQAFVTFPNTETATAALELVNGYHFRGKPIIVLYGRKSAGKVT
ncbi:RNA-binding protein 41-like [Haliotis rubra]|uniref:RNA-binding protein 41-like n=1 Tax=Haliotis rubra TaxID=36100 RepID=UPI001EE5BD1A|nr:RNA-binding protein 41-like [Haliotis rubra]